LGVIKRTAGKGEGAKTPDGCYLKKSIPTRRRGKCPRFGWGGKKERWRRKIYLLAELVKLLPPA